MYSEYESAFLLMIAVQWQKDCSKTSFLVVDVLFHSYDCGGKGQPSKACKCSFCVPSLETNPDLCRLIGTAYLEHHSSRKSPFSPVQVVFSNTIVSFGVHWICSTLSLSYFILSINQVNPFPHQPQ